MVFVLKCTLVGTFVNNCYQPSIDSNTSYKLKKNEHNWVKCHQSYGLFKNTDIRDTSIQDTRHSMKYIWIKNIICYIQKKNHHYMYMYMGNILLLHVNVSFLS